LIPVSSDNNRSFKISSKLILFEKSDSINIKLGIHQLTSDLQHIFEKGLNSIIKKNQQLLSQEQLKIYSLADEQVTIKARTSSEISFGSKMRFDELVVKDNKMLIKKKWLFTGLKVKFFIYSENGYLYLKYNNSFSRPVGPENLTTNKQSGTIPLNYNHAIKIFDVSYLASQHSKESVPFLASIPILKYLFSANNNQQVQKKITAIISIKEI
jgi:hypothetical protein